VEPERDFRRNNAPLAVLPVYDSYGVLRPEWSGCAERFRKIKRDQGCLRVLIRPDVIQIPRSFLALLIRLHFIYAEVLLATALIFSICIVDSLEAIDFRLHLLLK